MYFLSFSPGFFSFRSPPSLLTLSTRRYNVTILPEVSARILSHRDARSQRLANAAIIFADYRSRRRWIRVINVLGERKKERERGRETRRDSLRDA